MKKILKYCFFTLALIMSVIVLATQIPEKYIFAMIWVASMMWIYRTYQNFTLTPVDKYHVRLKVALSEKNISRNDRRILMDYLEAIHINVGFEPKDVTLSQIQHHVNALKYQLNGDLSNIRHLMGIHEAGHALALIAFGSEPIIAYVQRAHATTKGEPMGETPQTRQLMDMMVNIAGVIAEWKVYPHSQGLGSDSDLEKFESALTRYALRYNESISQTHHQLNKMANRFIELVEPELEIIAQRFIQLSPHSHFAPLELEGIDIERIKECARTAQENL